MPPSLSILDLAIIGKGETAAEALQGSVRLAQAAETAGYRRVWYAEHHNIPSIASAATSVLIAHVAAHTRTIALGSGGVMLPNHPPLVIAEQYGTLALLHPGRIELGLGRAPGTDQKTARALRRDPHAADTFPDDVLELQGYLRGESRIPGVQAIPGAGTNVPIYILGSSLFGAQLAASFGLPYAFASHFAPDALQTAVAVYRRAFKPSAQLDRPYVIAGVNVFAAATDAEAQAHRHAVLRVRAGFFLGGGRSLGDAEADALLASPQGEHMKHMMLHSAVGTPAAVKAYLETFATFADADELITVHAAPSLDARVRSLELLAGVWPPSGGATA